MIAERRTVRVAASLLDDLDRQLGSERGPNGEPSARDFELRELFQVIDRFAEGFDALPELIAGRHDDRVLITHGLLVPRFAVLGQVALDGAVELIQLDLDLDAGWD